MVDLSSDVKWGYYDEAAYAAGAGTNEYDMTALTSAGGMDYPSDSFTLPLQEYERDVKVSYDITSAYTFTKGLRYADSSFPMFVQTNTWVNYALNDGSFSIYYNTPALGVRTAYGCKVQKYTLEARAGEIATQTIDVIYYATATQTALAGEPTPLLSPQPLIYKDISLYVDGSSVRCAGSVSFTIENDLYDSMCVGSLYRAKPVLKSRKFTLEFDTFVSFADLDNATITNHSVSIEAGSLFTLSGSSVVLTKVGREEIPGERDAFKYNVTMEGGTWSI